jgi:hypothetical protein
MQRHGDQAVRGGAGRHRVRKTFAQCRRDGKLAVVFQARDQAVERKRIGQRGTAAVERGRVLEAGAAYLAVGRGDGALRALRQAVPRQVGPAGAAELAGSRIRAAQQAGEGSYLLKN